MAKKLSDYITDGLKTQKKTVQSQIDANNKANNSYVSSINKTYNNANKNLQTGAAQSTDELNQQYQSSYDKNAVSQLVAQRQLKERMANSGLTDSGLNRTQQTALSVAKANADNATTLQKTAAARAIQRTLQDNLSSNENNRLSQINAANLNNTDKNNALKQNMYQKAFDSAVSRINTDNTNKNNAQIAASNRAWEAQKAQMDRQTKLDVANIEAETKKATATISASSKKNNASDIITQQAYSLMTDTATTPTAATCQATVAYAMTNKDYVPDVNMMKQWYNSGNESTKTAINNYLKYIKSAFTYEDYRAYANTISSSK